MNARAIVTLVVVLTLTIISGAARTETCPALAGPPEAGTVLCCCATMNGQCCAYVIFCGGFVPGCFCAPGARPVSPQTS